MHSVACVCVSVCLYVTFESFDLVSSFLIRRYLQNLQVKFVHQDHRINVSVTGATVT